MSGLIVNLVRRLPRTPRQILQKVFGLCVVVEAATSQVEIFYRANLPRAALFIGSAYVTTVIFALLYAFYATNVPGDMSKDSLTGRSVTSGRNCFRLMGLISGLQLLGWALHFARLSTFSPLQIGFALLGAFVTMILLGLGNRAFTQYVSIKADLGIRA